MRSDFLNLPSSDVLREWVEPNLPSVEWDAAYEAQCSSWIEGENNYYSNVEAIQMRADIVSIEALNTAHGILLRGQDSKQPGRFREMDVIVGNHSAPFWVRVPGKMELLESFLLDEEIPPVFRAVWGHIMFETIHPYVDGNGRIGRWLVNKILGRPWSPIVLKERNIYYALLDLGNWQAWKEWMVNTLTRCPHEEHLLSSPWA